MSGIALLNAAGDMVASAGTGIDFQINRAATAATEHWDSQTVTLVNPVDLGTNLTYDFEGTNPPIILSRQDFTNRLATNRHRPAAAGTAAMNRRPNPDGADPTNLAAGRRSHAAAIRRVQPRMANLPATGGFRFRFGRPRWMSDEDIPGPASETGRA